MSHPRLDAAARSRYARQIRLPDFGDAAQAALLESHVLVIGAGGLGAPVLSYLAAVGVGTISVLDPDVVELSNLHRQVIHTESTIGTRKVDSAKLRMAGINSTLDIRTHPVLLTPDNALDLLTGVDLVIDGSDNFATRYLANDACEILGIPLVWGTILGFDGQVAVFDSRTAATLRDLYPDVPAPGSVPNCAVAGVLGPLCGSIGSAMAMEAIKVLTGIGTPLTNAVAVHNSLEASWETVPVSLIPGRDPVTSLDEHRRDYRDHDADLDMMTGSEAPSSDSAEAELGPATRAWSDLSSRTILIDIRDDDEVSAGMVPGAIHIPMDELLTDPHRLPLSQLTADRVEIALYCRSGMRSAQTVAQLRGKGLPVTSVTGGYLAYLSQPSAQTK